MARRLLFVILMYSFHEMQTQALLPPKLTVNPSVITETDSVTLNCQTPSSVSGHQCIFSTASGRIFRASSCLQRLTGTELLKMERSPAGVEVNCYYNVKQGDKNSPSPLSNMSSITIHILLPPKLTVNPSVITETESVTLNCQTPSSVSVHQCFFQTVSGRTFGNSSCQQRLTRTELLVMTHQSSPEVEVKCFYTVKYRDINSPSPHSNTSSITIQRQKPEISLEHFHGEYVLFACTLPGFANHDTRCNLYFGEASDPVTTTNIQKKRASKINQWFCLFTVTIDDLLRRLRLVQQSDASCDYSLGSEPNSLSLRSDGRSLTDIVKAESHTTQTMPTSTVTTGLTVSTPRASTTVTPEKTSGTFLHSPSRPVSTPSITFLTSVKAASGSSVSMPVTKERATPLKTASGLTVGNNDSFISTSPTASDDTTAKTPRNPTETWILVAAGSGVTVGVILLGLALLCHKRRTGRWSNKRTQATVTDDYMHMRNLDHGELLPAGNNEAYSVITSIRGADCPTGIDKLKKQETRNEDSDTYHVYCTIPEEKPPIAMKDMVYSTVQAH